MEWFGKHYDTSEQWHKEHLTLVDICELINKASVADITHTIKHLELHGTKPELRITHN